jgi:hypothetical protein
MGNGSLDLAARNETGRASIDARGRAGAARRGRARVLLSALILAAGLGSGICAKAGDTGPAERAGWSFQVTPYLWGAGLEGDIGTRSALPTAEVDASFRDILENTDIGLMLVGEARYRRWGAFADLAYLSVSADGDTPGPLFGDAEAEADTLVATLGAAYRVVDRAEGWLDLVAGGRLWSVDTDVTFETGLLPKRKTGVSESWADPVVGLRGQIDLGSGFAATAYADIGGGASDLTWQVLGTLDYRFSDRVEARIGYRHLSVDYSDGGFVWDVEMSGPIIGLSVRF